MANTWKSDSFKPYQIKKYMKEDIFKTPRYQRGIVWSDKQRSELVDTIKKGLPFGSLLLYKSGNVYQIIDGLQRSTAVVGFVDNPAQFFNEDDIDDDTIEKITEVIGLSGNQITIKDTIRSNLVSWVKSHTTMEQVKSMQFALFGRQLSSVFPTCVGKEFDIGDIVSPALKAFQKTCETISEIDIPAIVIEGDDDQLALLFERINSKGTQLSKYQIYAASWIKDEYDIDEKLKDIVMVNRDRYDMMLDGKTEIDGYDSADFLNAKKLNAFEIAFGLGKVLCRDYPHLFGVSSDETSVESIGFNLINTCLGQKNKDTSHLNAKLKELVGNENINTFLNLLVDCVSFVNNRVGKYNSFKSNTRENSGKRPLHSEFQICSLISSVFLLKYADIILTEQETIKSFSLHLNSVNETWKKELKRLFIQNAPRRYILEILQNRWSGSGDRKLDQILIMPDYYTRPVDEDDFSLVMDNWFNTMNSERAEIGRVASPKEPELLMLAVVYLLHNFTADKQLNDSKYDIEHLATKQLMKERLSAYNGDLRLPISSFGNLCLLPESENRGKGKKTLYDDTDYLKNSSLTLKEIEENYSFTTRDDLEWLHEPLGQDEFSEKYKNFITCRYNRMKAIIMGNFDKI